jgi:hypothetical protein
VTSFLDFAFAVLSYSVVKLFPYALWRDLVLDQPDYLAFAEALKFPYALWRDLVLDQPDYLAFAEALKFPYALWRDLVLDPTPVGAALTSADVTGLHRCLAEGPCEVAGSCLVGCLR